jgi:hypothetical protein
VPTQPSTSPAQGPPGTVPEALGGNARSERLTIAVLLDYANFISGGYEAHLREALDAKCRRDGHTLLFLYGAPLDAPHPLGKADNAIFRALRSDSFDGLIVASAMLAAYSGPERVARRPRTSGPRARTA